MRRPLGFALAGVAAFAAGLATAAEGPRGPGLGRPLSAEEAAQVDISIPPDGSGLPPGGGTVEEGEAIYAAKCEACHGVAGANGPMDRLTGGVGTIATTKRVKTTASFWPYATTLFDYVRRAMPLTAPQSLSDDETYAVTAYLLSVDDIIPKDARLDATVLPTIRMPNRDGFVRAEPRDPP